MSECGEVFGLGYGRGSATCVRPKGHPNVGVDGIGHNDGVHPTYPDGEGPQRRTVESFEERVERLRPEREMKPESCSHCGFDTVFLTNYSREYGGFVGAHWLCAYCEVTLSASRQGSGGDYDNTVRDMAMMLHVLEKRLRR